MPKNEFTPRDQLVCGKLDALHDAIVSGDTETACGLVDIVRRDCQRMELKLSSRKDEAIAAAREIERLTRMVEDVPEVTT